MAEGEKLKSHPPVTGDDEERIFDFFGLPRELRNEIYSMLTEDVEVQNGYDDDGDVPFGLQITVQSKMLLTPRLLNQQFKNEYEQETKGHQVLVLKDIGGPFDKMNTARVTTGVRSAIIRLLVTCRPYTSSNYPCNCVGNFEEHVKWINGQFKLLRSLQDVKLEIHPCSPYKGDIEWNDHGREAIENFKNVLEFSGDFQIKVFPLFRDKRGNLVKAYEDEAAPVSKWTRTGGWQDR